MIKNTHDVSSLLAFFKIFVASRHKILRENSLSRFVEKWKTLTLTLPPLSRIKGVSHAILGNFV